MSDDPKLDEAIRRWVAEADAGEHPGADRLLRYHLRELPEAEAESVRDHLSLCESCTRQLLGYERFAGGELAGEPAGEEISAEELERAWRQVRDRLGGEGAAPVPTVPRSWFLSAAALAAVLLVAVIGLGVLQVGPSPGRDGGEVVRADLLVESLTPRRGPARGGGPANELRLPGWARRVVVVLAYEAMERHPAYTLSLEDARGRELWRQEGVPRAPQGHFTLELPRTLLAPGEYVIVLSAEPAGEPTPLARYPFSIPTP